MIRRVRTGCKTCRRRRIKCDEGKPICDRCRTANFHCEGFEAPRTTSKALVKRSSSSRRDVFPRDELVQELPWRQPNWRQEQLPLYHHFVTSTVDRLFRVDHVSFWRNQVAQMSFGDDTVYEAVLAVGAAHRASLLSCSIGDTREVARCKVLGFKAYGRALRLLATNLVQNAVSDPWAVLIVLLLCAYFECFMENSKGALGHLWAAIQVLRRSEAHLSTIDLANMAPIYEVVLRLDFLAQKLLPYAGSSFSRCSDLAFMELPFWSRQNNEGSLMTQSDSIATELHRLIQLVCGHNKLSRVVWGGWLPTSERPSRDELIGFHTEMLLWKATSPATFKNSDLESIYAPSIAELDALPMPPRPLYLTSSEAAVNIIMFNGYMGCALAMISTTDEDPVAREIEAFNLVYQNLCITAGLIYRDNAQSPSNYKPCDALDLGISMFLYHGARRCYSLDWHLWTISALRKIGREGLCNANAAANTLEIMSLIETTSPHIKSTESTLIGAKPPLGSIRDRLIPLLMPRGEDNQFLSYFLRYGTAEADNDERVVRIVGRATWKQDASGTMQSLEVDTYQSTDTRSIFLAGDSGTMNIFSSWRPLVERGWHGFVS